MRPFIYRGLPARVVFGFGTTESLADELQRLGISRPFVVTTPQQADMGERLRALAGDLASELFSEATMHTPVAVTERAMTAFAAARSDGIVAIGGGSTIGLGKAIALRNDAPQVVLPTSYAGSEMTTIIGQTVNGLKTTQKSLRVLPETVIYDIHHTLTLPPLMTITSGINAIAHAVEALYAEEANPVLSLLASDGISKMASALARVTAAPGDLDVRSDALHGAFLCAICLGSGGIALHHKLCHVLGGAFDLPHAETHTVVLPHALAYNAPAVPDAMRALRAALGSPSPAGAIYDIAATGGAPTSLRELGMPEDGIEHGVRLSLQNPYLNPRPLDSSALRQLLRNAWEGRRSDD